MGTVRAELGFGLRNRGLGDAAVARGVEEAALALGISPLLDRVTSELSGGELQRTALGAALAGRPDVLVLDEPTSQLDPVAGDELIGLLRRANEDADTTILLAEHRLERCLYAPTGRSRSSTGGSSATEPRRSSWRGRSRMRRRWPRPGRRCWPGSAASRSPASRARGRRCAGGGCCRTVGDSEPRSAKSSRTSLDKSHTRVAAAVSVATGPRRAPALELRGVWHELRSGPVLLRGVDLTLAPGERVALLGRNGAGKSTLLRHAAGLMAPTRGTVRAAGRVGLLMQNPGDYLVHERVCDEAPEAALRAVGLDGPAFAQRHPRELSGGEKQRLALAVVLGDPGDGAEPTAVLCLDEPTRGMDRDHKRTLTALLEGLDGAVLVATHDAEFAASFAAAGAAARRWSADRRRPGA